MTAAPTRPPWLCRERELEAFIEALDPTLSISALRHSRNDCHLVGALLARIVSAKNLAPGDWELNLARIHLAVDVQHILKRWCGIGLQKTLDGSELGILFASEDCAGVQDVAAEEEDEVASPQTVVESGWRPDDKNRVVAVQPPKRPLEDGGHYDGPVKVARLEDAGDHYEESVKAVRIEFRCPYYTQNPLTHPECADKTFPNPRKLKYVVSPGETERKAQRETDAGEESTSGGSSSRSSARPAARASGEKRPEQSTRRAARPNACPRRPPTRTAPNTAGTARSRPRRARWK